MQPLSPRVLFPVLLAAPDSCNTPTLGFNGSGSPLTTMLAFGDECFAQHTPCALRIQGIKTNSFSNTRAHTRPPCKQLGHCSNASRGQQAELSLYSPSSNPHQLKMNSRQFHSLQEGTHTYNIYTHTHVRSEWPPIFSLRTLSC